MGSDELEKEDVNSGSHMEGDIVDFLPPEPTGVTSKIKDPEQMGGNWHICRDLIDPLIGEIEEALEASDDTGEHVESLYNLVSCLEGVGPRNYANAWSRARCFLMLNTPEPFQQAFVQTVLELGKKAGEVVGRLASMPLEGEEANWRHVEITGFDILVCERCIENLCRMSQELSSLIEKLPPGGSHEYASREGSGGAENALFDPSLDTTAAEIGKTACGPQDDSAKISGEVIQRPPDWETDDFAKVPYPTMQDSGIGHILRSACDCENVLSALLDGSCTTEGIESLRAASEELQRATEQEWRTLSLASNGPCCLLGSSWPTGHECLSDSVARLLPDSDAASKAPQHYRAMIGSPESWRRLRSQLVYERRRIESGNEVSLNSLALIQEVQRFGGRDGKATPLDGRSPENSPEAKTKRAAAKANETKKTAADEREKESQQRANQLKNPELKDWLAWALTSGKIDIYPDGEKRFRVTWQDNAAKLTQAEIAAKLSFVLETPIKQQRISEMVKKVDKWRDANLPTPDLKQLVANADRKDVSLEELKILIDSDGQVYR